MCSASSTSSSRSTLGSNVNLICSKALNDSIFCWGVSPFSSGLCCSDYFSAFVALSSRGFLTNSSSKSFFIGVLSGSFFSSSSPSSSSKNVKFYAILMNNFYLIAQMHITHVTMHTIKYMTCSLRTLYRPLVLSNSSQSLSSEEN